MAQALLALALFLNVGVLVPVLLGLMRDAPWAEAAYGPDSPARQILVTLYATILGASLVALALAASGQQGLATGLAVPLLALQVSYKLLTLPAVGAANPVVRANLGIAAFHALTLAVLFLQ